MITPESVCLAVVAVVAVLAVLAVVAVVAVLAVLGVVVCRLALTDSGGALAAPLDTGLTPHAEGTTSTPTRRSGLAPARNRGETVIRFRRRAGAQRFRSMASC